MAALSFLMNPLHISHFFCSNLQAAELADLDLASFPNTVAWAEKCVKLVPNYEKVTRNQFSYFSKFHDFRPTERVLRLLEDSTSQSAKM